MKDWAVWLAIYGAVVATGTLVWTLYRDTSNRSRTLDVHAFIGFSDADPKGRDHLVVRATNIGRENVFVAVLALEVSRPGAETRSVRILRDRAVTFPKKLEPGESVGIVSNDLTLLDDPLLKIFAETTTGRRFDAGRLVLDGIHRQVNGARALRKPGDS